MDFRMEVDSISRKRGREELDLYNEDRVVKKARSFDAFAPARDAASPSPSEASLSSAASVDGDHDSFRQPRCTIISGLNQARRDQYLRQGYPMSWLHGSMQVSTSPSWVR